MDGISEDSEGWNPQEVGRALQPSVAQKIAAIQREDEELANAFGSIVGSDIRDKYTPEMGEIFCNLIASGLGVKQCLRYPGMPSTKGSIYGWLHRYPEFAEKYRMAQASRAEAYVEEMIEIADDASDDIEWGKDGPKIKGSAIRRAQLRIDTRKWVVSKHNNARFGEKILNEHTGKNGAPLGDTHFNITLLPSGTVLEPEAEDGVTIEHEAPV